MWNVRGNCSSVEGLPRRFKELRELEQRIAGLASDAGASATRRGMSSLDVEGRPWFRPRQAAPLHRGE